MSTNALKHQDKTGNTALHRATWTVYTFMPFSEFAETTKVFAEVVDALIAKNVALTLKNKNKEIPHFKDCGGYLEAFFDRQIMLAIGANNSAMEKNKLATSILRPQKRLLLKSSSCLLKSAYYFMRTNIKPSTN